MGIGAYWNDGGRESPMPPVLSRGGGRSVWLSVHWEPVSEWELSARTSCQQKKKIKSELHTLPPAPPLWPKVFSQNPGIWGKLEEEKRRDPCQNQVKFSLHMKTSAWIGTEFLQAPRILLLLDKQAPQAGRGFRGAGTAAFPELPKHSSCQHPLQNAPTFSGCAASLALPAQKWKAKSWNRTEIQPRPGGTPPARSSTPWKFTIQSGPTTKSLECHHHCWEPELKPKSTQPQQKDVSEEAQTPSVHPPVPILSPNLPSGRAADRKRHFPTKPWKPGYAERPLLYFMRSWKLFFEAAPMWLSPSELLWHWHLHSGKLEGPGRCGRRGCRAPSTQNSHRKMELKTLQGSSSSFQTPRACMEWSAWELSQIPALAKAWCQF